MTRARQAFHGLLRLRGQPPQLPDHEIHYIVSVFLGADAIHVPLPSPRDCFEREQPFFGQRREELDSEERIAAGLLLIR